MQTGFHYGYKCMICFWFMIIRSYQRLNLYLTKYIFIKPIGKYSWNIVGNYSCYNGTKAGVLETHTFQTYEED